MVRHRSVLAVGAVVLAAGLVLAPGVSAVPENLTEIDNSYAMTDGGSFDTFAPWVSSLDSKVPGAEFTDVVADGNRPGSDLCRDTGIDGATGFCWNDGDDGTSEWYPQGISGSWDADPSGSYQGHRAIFVSWYHKGDKGARVSLVNYDDPAKPVYRHVLLVEPTGEDNFKQVPVHAGGIAWVGNYLHVVDTDKGVRVFDLNHLWRTEPDSSESKIGLVDGKYYAYNYAYVLPQVGAYSQEGSGDCDPAPVDQLDAPLCFSWVSLDRSTTPPSLLTGEFYYGTVGGARMVRWDLDPSTGLLATDGAGALSSKNAYQSPEINIQGGLSYNGTFLATSSRDAGTRSIVYRATVGEPSTEISVPPGIEDLSHDPADGRTWSLSEHPDNRMVFGIPGAIG